MKTSFKFVTSVLLCLSLSFSAGASVTVSGKVIDSDTHLPVCGVVISDGLQCTVTDSAGCYRFVSDKSGEGYIFAVTPSEYEFSFNGYGLWNDYIPVDFSNDVSGCDFSIAPRKDASGTVRIILLGDPQRMSSRPHSVESWERMCIELDKYRRTVDGPLYQIMLGDMVTNEIEVEEMSREFLKALSTSGIRTFSIPGNHDHIQKLRGTHESISAYTKTFGPYNYAANIGGFHLIFLNSSNWDESGKFHADLDREAMAFLRNDLRYVPAGKPILIFTHCPLTKEHGGKFPSPSCYDELIGLLEGREVHMWYGHIHFNAGYSYTDAELASLAPGLTSLDSHIAGRCAGNWACSGELLRDGSPRGFVELELNDSQIRWRYLQTVTSYPEDFNVYMPGRFSEYLYCNIYVWDNKWSLPEIWIDGKREGTMQKVVSEKYDASYDPLYAHLFKEWSEMGIQGFRKAEYPRQYDNNHLFKYLPPQGVRSVEIRFKDRWGAEYRRTVSW